ncbi:hypothetical protein LJ737_24100 [Hymenobacter sp. 15J16-1T3B]|uniref:hypothetical protein n=1 Tax=Hymenobacter sp. 15J16-1T3B TaxID=2886941 RepID=UPI001D1274A8|nr:hypothetical protein [Hymenobacter sp. 15J16-1T3B]MCC3160340.1 hypothetical protein [Hymenobacter sp. 15J16-1T3B]
MDDAYLSALGFEQWVSQLPLQTTMYVHRCPAQDGARLYLAIPPAAAPESAPACRARFEAQVERFFRKHGGRRSAPAPQPVSLA